MIGLLLMSFILLRLALSLIYNSVGLYEKNKFKSNQLKIKLLIPRELLFNKFLC